MSSEPNMDWLQTDGLKSVVAQRFAEFCANDFKAHKVSEDSDADSYKEAVQLVIGRIEAAVARSNQ